MSTLSGFVRFCYAPTFLYGQRSLRTINEYATSVGYYLKLVGDPHLSEIDPPKNAKFIHGLQAMGLSIETIRKHCRNLNAVWAKAGPPGLDMKTLLEVKEEAVRDQTNDLLKYRWMKIAKHVKLCFEKASYQWTPCRTARECTIDAKHAEHAARRVAAAKEEPATFKQSIMEEAKKHTPPTAAMLAALAIEKKRGPAKTELGEYLRARETGDQERVDRKDGGRGPINPTRISQGYSNSKPKDDTTQLFDCSIESVYSELTFSVP